MIRFIYKIYNPNAKRDKHGRVIQDVSRRKHSKAIKKKIDLQGNRKANQKFRVRPRGGMDMTGGTK